MDICA